MSWCRLAIEASTGIGSQGTNTHAEFYSLEKNEYNQQPPEIQLACK